MGETQPIGEQRAMPNKRIKRKPEKEPSTPKPKQGMTAFNAGGASLNLAHSSSSAPHGHVPKSVPKGLKVPPTHPMRAITQTAQVVSSAKLSLDTVSTKVGMKTIVPDDLRSHITKFETKMSDDHVHKLTFEGAAPVLFSPTGGRDEGLDFHASEGQRIPQRTTQHFSTA